MCFLSRGTYIKKMMRGWERKWREVLLLFIATVIMMVPSATFKIGPYTCQQKGNSLSDDIEMKYFPQLAKTCPMKELKNGSLVQTVPMLLPMPALILGSCRRKILPGYTCRAADSIIATSKNIVASGSSHQGQLKATTQMACHGSLAIGSSTPATVNFTTNTEQNYRFELPRVPSNNSRNLQVSFRVKAANDVHVALAPTADSKPFYEIVIGGWGNTRSVIRRCSQCADLTEDLGQMLDESQMRPFLIRYRDGLVSVWNEQPLHLLMTYEDAAPLSISAVGFSTGYGSSGLFIFRTCDMY